MKKRDIYLVLIALIFLAFFTGFFIAKSYGHYSLWKEYRNYFKEPNPQIESWMSLRTIEKRFNIVHEELYKTIGANSGSVNSHISLDVLCKEADKNCTEIIIKLNNLAENG